MGPIVFLKDRWRDEDRHDTKRPGLAESFAADLAAALAVLRQIHPLGQPLRATTERIPRHPRSFLAALDFNPHH